VLILVYLSGANTALFLWLNHLSAYTGDPFWAGITVFGDTLVVLALLLPWWRRRPDLVWAALLAAVMAAVWTHGLKYLADVPRPPAVLPPEAFHVIGPAYRTGSFPSGHSTAIFTFAGVVFLSSALTWLRWPLLAFAALVAVSRSVVGVHWPLDLLGGMLGGWLSALGGLWLASRWRWGLRAPLRWLAATVLALAAGKLLIGHDTGYPGAIWLLRSVGAACLLAWLGDILILVPRPVTKKPRS
jgi:membrane-associated phospholipid phosphatase